MPPMATATTTTMDSAAAARRFAAACGVLSQYVKAAAAPVPAVDGAPQQLTIFYGGRVVVLDGCTPARAAELIRYAAAAASAPEPAPVPSTTVVDIPIARKASLQRFLAKRKDKSVAAVEGPAYSRWEETAASPPAKKGKTEASSWLALGSFGDVNAP